MKMTLLAAGTLLLCACVETPIAQTQKSVTAEYPVVETQDDAEYAYRVLKRKAKSACTNTGIRGAREPAGMRECYGPVLAKAVKDADNPAVTALYEAEQAES